MPMPSASIIQRDLTLKRKPTNGAEAHKYLIDAIKSEMDDLRVMLEELSEPTAKAKFIKEWNPRTRRVSVRD